MGNWGATMNDKTRLDPLLLTIPDAARLIGLHRDTVWEMCYNREIESVKIGKARRIVYADLVRWVEGKREQEYGETTRQG
jgi:excisionase family DNA binding protein